MRTQVDAVRGLLAQTEHAEVRVRGALCFIGVTVGLFAKHFELDDVVVSWPKPLAKLLRGQAGDAEPLHEVHRTLDERLRPTR